MEEDSPAVDEDSFEMDEDSLEIDSEDFDAGDDLLSLNFDHPRAPDYLWAFGIRHGIPVVFSIAVLVILMLPSMRTFYRVKQRAYTRRPRTAGRPRR